MDLTYQEIPSASPLVERIWHSRAQEAADFYSMADIHSELVVTRWHGKTTFTIRGPETHATLARTQAGAEYFGIQFKTGVFMPAFPPALLVDRHDVHLPEASSRSFWLAGAAWEFPTFENADTFIHRLDRAGYLVHDPLVGDVLRQKPVDLSPRTVQRRFAQAAGLAHGAIYQIERARYAVSLLLDGVSILDTVEAAGYFDQPHLTRALKRLIGLPPAYLLRKDRPERLSFLYKTSTVQDAILMTHEQTGSRGESSIGRPLAIEF